MSKGLGLGVLICGATWLAWLGAGPARGAPRQGELPCAVVNGGMEDTAPTLQPRDWTATTEVRSSPRARNGERSVVFVGRYGTLSQRLAVRRTPAEGATLSFWLRRDAGLDDFRLRVYLGGFELPLAVGPDQVPVDRYAPFQVVVPPEVFGAPDAALVFSYQRNGLTGQLDMDDVELDFCAFISPTPPPTGPSTAVPDTSTCAVRNGGFEVLEGVRPRFWEWTGNVEGTTRAMQTGARSVRFTQGNASLSQTLAGVPDLGRPARLWLWVYREEGAGGFRLRLRVAGQLLLDYTPANLPVGQLPVTVPFELPAPGPAGTVPLAFEWAMSGSGAVYVDDVALDLCPATAPTTTPSATPSPSATATASRTPSPSPTYDLTAGPPTPSATATATTATAAASRTATRTATAAPTTPLPTASPRGPRPVALPYLARLARLPAPAARVWGLELPLDGDPDYFAVAEALELPRARRTGLTAVRTNLRWDALEPADTVPDQYDWTESDRRLAAYAGAGFDTLVTLVAYPKWATTYACGYGLLPGREADWRELVRAVVTRYSRPPYRVKTWEIGNEPDGETVVRPDDEARPAGWGRGEPTVPHGGCWGDRAPEYKAFLQAAYEEVKAADPEAQVLVGSLAFVLGVDDFVPDFFDQLLAAGAAPYFDIMGYHWFPNLIQDVTGPQKHRILSTSLARAGAPKPLWLTETFRLIFANDPLSEPAQIRFLSREIIEMLAQPDLARVYYYGYQDLPPGYGNIPTAQRGLIRGDHSPKPAFRVLPYTIQYTAGPPRNLSTAKVTAWRFSRARLGEDYLVAWSRDGKPQRLSLEVPPGTVATLTWFPEAMMLAGRCCGKATVAAAGGVLTLEVGADPVFVDLSGR